MARQYVRSTAGRSVRRWANMPTMLSRLGLAGSICLTVSSYWVGAVPLYFRAGHTPVVSIMAISSLVPRLAFYLGLATVLFGWLQLGRLTLDRVDGTDWRSLRRIALRWATPLMLAMPIGSRDLWAYAAQSQLVLHHLDPYSFGPSALPGAFSVEVSHRWIDTPAPYGPLWLSIGHLIAAVVGNHVALTVAVLRSLALLGLVIAAYSVPALAGRIGGRADIAVWLIIANPLTLVLGLGGGHNDLLMVGLLVAGLAALTGPGGAWRTLGAGIVLLTAATAIKSPAAVALAFSPALWLVYAPSGQAYRSTLARTMVTALVAVTSIGVFAAITAVSGLGLGWVKQVNSAAPVVSWMSLPSLAAIVWDLLQGQVRHAIKLDPTMQYFRTAGTVLSIITLTLLCRLGLATQLPESMRRKRAFATRSPDPWRLLAASLFLIVVLGPSVQPWYFCWALSVAGVAIVDVRRISLIAGCCVGLVALIRPNGTGLQMNPIVVPIFALGVSIAWLALRSAHRSDRQSPHSSRLIESRSVPLTK